MRIGARSLASLLAIGVVVTTAVPSLSARAAPALEVGRMKHIILPPEGPTDTAGTTTTNKTANTAPRTGQASPPPASQPRALSNPVPNSVPVQGIIQRANRVQGAGPVVPGPLP